MLYAGIFIWWLCGVISFLWLRRGEWTWATIAGAVTIWGAFGPPIWIVIAAVAFIQADFWNKPVFQHRPRSGK